MALGTEPKIYMKTRSGGHAGVLIFLASKSSPDVLCVSSSPTLSIHGFKAETEKLTHSFGGTANPDQGAAKPSWCQSMFKAQSIWHLQCQANEAASSSDSFEAQTTKLSTSMVLREQTTKPSDFDTCHSYANPHYTVQEPHHDHILSAHHACSSTPLIAGLDTSSLNRHSSLSTTAMPIYLHITSKEITHTLTITHHTRNAITLDTLCNILLLLRIHISPHGTHYEKNISLRDSHNNHKHPSICMVSLNNNSHQIYDVFVILWKITYHDIIKDGLNTS